MGLIGAYPLMTWAAVANMHASSPKADFFIVGSSVFCGVAILDGDPFVGIGLALGAHVAAATLAIRTEGPRTGPGDLLRTNALGARARQAPDPSFQEELGRPQVQVSPPAYGPIVVGRRRVTAWAPHAPGPPAEADYDADGGEADPGHGSSGDGEHPVECRGDAHVSPLSGEGAVCSTCRTYPGSGTCASFVAADQ